jgi:hypothetical protein
MLFLFKNLELTVELFRRDLVRYLFSQSGRGILHRKLLKESSWQENGRDVLQVSGIKHSRWSYPVTFLSLHIATTPSI